MSRLKVLVLVDHAVGISGPHRNVVGSLNALGAREDAEVVLVTGKVDIEEPYASAENIDIRIGFSPHNPARVLANLTMLRKAAKGCNVIYVPSGLKALLYAQTIRVGRRLVAGPNVAHIPLLPASRHDSPGRLQVARLSDAWFEPSRVRRNHVADVSGVADVSYIHHAIDLLKFSRAHRNETLRDRLGVPPDGLLVLFVGRDNEESKGSSQFLDAAELIGGELNGTPVQFVLVGKMSEVTKARVARHPYMGATGFLLGQALPQMYASADLAVLPSTWETFGFTVLESMASGLPVVTTFAGAIPEVMVDGETGIMLDIVTSASVHTPDAAERIAEAIRWLAEHPQDRLRMGKAARARAELHFSESRLGEDLITIFKSEKLPNRDDEQEVDRK